MRKFFRQFGLGVLVMMAVLAAMTALPQDVYVRWQAMKVEAFARLGWIYERIHFDDTPIDIAFIGTSHTMNGIDGQAFEDKLTAAGARTNDDRCLHAVNLAVPSYGRDLHLALARELLNNRKVKVLVLEVFENETRKAHPLFVHVADVKDVLDAPLLINLNYFHNLVRLPFRQLSLAVKSLMPSVFGLKDHFYPSDYDGSDVDNTRVVNVGGAALSPYRDHVMDSGQLQKAAREHLAAKNLHMLNFLGPWAERYEYAVPDYYVTSLLDLAHEKGVDVVFLYLPQYGMPPKPADDTLYRGKGDWIFVNDVLQKPEYWFEESHLNAQGAAAVTNRVAEEFLFRWKSLEQDRKRDEVTLSDNPRVCTDHAYPVRATLKPFHSTKKNTNLDEEAP